MAEMKMVRIEPHAQTTDLSTGLAAEVADPLWMLLRQWQLGELTGDDAGSPVAVDLAASWSPFTRFRADGSTAPGAEPAPVVHLDPAGPTHPLETRVEREFLLDPTAASWTARVETGRALRRLLVAADLKTVADRLAEEYPFEAAGPPDELLHPDDRRYRRLLAPTGGAAGRAPTLDGVKVLGAGALPAHITQGVSAAAVTDALANWRVELGEDWGPLEGKAGPADAWVGDRLEYDFSLAAPPLSARENELVFRAREYDGTGLSWYSLDLDTAPDATLDAADDPGADSVVWTTLPTRLTYPGMPADRFWEFEDGAVQLGRVSAGPTDLARMLAIDFAVVYSPDWFVVPLDLPVGSVARIDWVIVRDTFGTATLVGTPATQTADEKGKQFQPSGADGRDTDNPFMVVLPSALATITSPAREEVTLQRDEVANLGWAIEKWVLGPAGRGTPMPWSRREFELVQPETTDYDIAWRLSTPVAKTWSPLVSVERPDGQVLRKARLLATATGELVGTRSQIMANVENDIRDEEITRAGIQVRIIEQLTRGRDGSTHVWRGRDKRPWRGEVSSALRYDSTSRPPFVRPD